MTQDPGVGWGLGQNVGSYVPRQSENWMGGGGGGSAGVSSSVKCGGPEQDRAWKCGSLELTVWLSVGRLERKEILKMMVWSDAHQSRAVSAASA